MTAPDLDALVARIEDYGFECEAGPLTGCIDWHTLRTALRERVPPIPRERWRHRNTGTYQRITDAVAEWNDQLALVVYRSEIDGRTWVRPASEFYDGRFTRLDAAAPAPQEPCTHPTTNRIEGTWCSKCGNIIPPPEPTSTPAAVYGRIVQPSEGQARPEAVDMSAGTLSAPPPAPQEPREIRRTEYAEKAEAITRYSNAKPPNTNAMMAVVTELALDASKRADLAAKEPKP